ncbi:PPR domain-containing protein/PPR_2 domain-containing protein/PPR_3 domain-containing protein [Cephalotus follicularis]|uniref:PPR domain-containing protein/PPR_2 domain-containing protein/PPR_3 domain-containing protein n=1 Tax=Cephalotus follicularis TaxID=3775 RepID=A0A1Q3D6U3_CEPFO|nr:PPR domain-containing protein/PPR_2 domain-containing protein/PPR_3 domain-containing protein [Cephalotus follicularis]
MQALSIWPSLGGFLVVPHLEYEIGFSCFSSSRYKRRHQFYIVESLYHSRSAGLLLFPGNSRFSRTSVCSKSSNFDMKWKYYKFKVFLSYEPKGGSLSTLVGSVWALEQQEIGNEFLELESNSAEGLLGKNESKGVKDSDDNDNDNDDKGDIEEVDANSEGEVGELESTRIDVRALAHSLWFAKTADHVEEVLKDKGDKLPVQVFSTMIRGFGRDKRIDSAMAIIKWLKKKKKETGSVIGPNIFIYNSLLGAVKQSEQFEELEKIMKDMAEEEILPNVVTYNTLMKIYLEKGEATKALNILEEIQIKGFTLSAASYSTALLAYRRMEDGNGALKFFVESREKYRKGEIGIDTDEDWGNEFDKLENFTIRICYQVMRRWLVKSENLSTNLLKLLSDMDKAGLQPDRAEHERLLWACTREEHYAVAKELYSRIRERYSGISLSVCNHLIWLMGKAKKWWAALEIYEDLLDKGPKPNTMSCELIVSHFNILLTAASKRGIWRWGVRLLNKMEDKGLKPGSRQWNAVLIACSKAAETSAAVQVFRRMVEQGERPTIVSYGALLSVLEKGKLYDEALKVWEHMLKMGVEPNSYAYTIMASIFTRKGNFKVVDDIFLEMAASGIEPTVVTYNAIISACARNGMSGSAYEWFHRMEVQKISPNEISYEMLIEALANDGEPRLAYELYLRAHNEGLDLSSKAYDIIVQSSQVHGATIDLSVLGPRPPDRRRKVQIRKTLTEFCNLADVPRRYKPFHKEEIYTPKTGDQ